MAQVDRARRQEKEAQGLAQLRVRRGGSAGAGCSYWWRTGPGLRHCWGSRLVAQGLATGGSGGRALGDVTENEPPPLFFLPL